MLYRGVNIFTCKFFAVDNESKQLKFIAGQFRGKKANDFNQLTDIQKVFGYCFWIINNPTCPPVSKYTAAAFLKELSSKLVEVESKLNAFMIADQKRLEQETEESAKNTGTKYV